MAGSDDTGRARPTRRAFLGTSAAAAVTAVAGSSLVAGGCASVPQARFAAGRTGELAAQERRFLEAHNVWLMRGEQGYAAISAICTHMGCRTSAASEGEGFVCGCHGSAFHADGTVAEGPADEPLTWYAITFEGEQLFVDGRAPVALGTWFAPPGS